MKSLELLQSVLFAATAAVAQFIIDPVFFPFDTSITSTGITLLADEGAAFTNITVTWDFPSSLCSSVTKAGLEWVTQYASVDLMPVPFDFVPPEYGTLLPFPAHCPDFLQVGINMTELFVSVDNSPNCDGILDAFAFFTWNNVTTNITDASGTPITFVPGETVTVTLLVSEDGTNATVLYDSTVHGLIQIPLSEGSLCLTSVQWAAGSPTANKPLGFTSDFEKASAGVVDIALGNSTIQGPSLGSITILQTEQAYGNLNNIAGPLDITGTGFVFQMNSDDFEY